MKFSKMILIYLITAIVFFAIDILWLGFVGKAIYDKYLGHLLAENTNWLSALIFYLIYIGGILYFSSVPAYRQNSLKKAIISGAFLGFLCYATFELTAFAVLADWPPEIVWIDIFWGAFLTSSVSLLSFLIMRKIGE